MTLKRLPHEAPFLPYKKLHPLIFKELVRRRPPTEQELEDIVRFRRVVYVLNASTRRVRAADYAVGYQHDSTARRLSLGSADQVKQLLQECGINVPNFPPLGGDQIYPRLRLSPVY